MKNRSEKKRLDGNSFLLAVTISDDADGAGQFTL